MKVVAVSGHFDPIHIGHLIHMKMAKALGDKLVVIVDSHEAGRQKRGFSLIPCAERMALIREFSFVDEVIAAIDDDTTVAKTIELIRPDILAKGGDRDLANIPEAEKEACERVGCEIITGQGERKPYHSSSDFVLKVIQSWSELSAV